LSVRGSEEVSFILVSCFVFGSSLSGLEIAQEMKAAIFQYMAKVLQREKGMVLPAALVFLGVLVLLGTTAVVTTTTEMKIGGNYKIGEQAFYEAQGGCEEARARLRANVVNPINDAYPTQTQWRAYVGGLASAKERGYDPSNAMHVRYDHLPSDFGYTAQIRHQTDAGDNIVYWGDTNGDAVNERNTSTGENIYLVSSYGSTGGSNKTIEVEVMRIPTITVPSALYVEAATTVQGSGTYVIGTDSCGSADKAGIVTTENPGSVTINGNPHVTGVGGGEPNIVYNGTDMRLGNPPISLTPSIVPPTPRGAPRVRGMGGEPPHLERRHRTRLHVVAAISFITIPAGPM
jgi:Tfp pilus assembly protein PilX